MGALLGQKTNNYTEHDLGASTWDTIKDIGTFNLFGASGLAIRKLGLFGGDSCSDSDLQTRDELEAAIEALLSYQERRRLVSYANSDISPTPREMANFTVGGVKKWGGDCKHKNVGSGDKRFMAELESMLKEKAHEAQLEAQQSSSSSTSGSGSSGSGSSSSGSQTNSSGSSSSSGSGYSNGSENGSNNSGVPAQQQTGIMRNNATTYAILGGGGLLLILGTIALTK